MDGLLGDSVFREVAALLALAAGVGFLGLLLRQPLIVAFLAVGLLAGPSGLDIVRSNDQIDLLSQLGVAVLLFLVGIKLDVQLIRSLGGVALTTGLGQVGFTSVLGIGIALGLGLNPVESVYVAVALTFSSTIIIVKLLSDKREIDSLHGQVALGFLIVQDLVVVLAMIVLSAVGVGVASGSATADVVGVLGAGLLLVAVVALIIRYLADPLTAWLAQAPELLICFAIAMAAAFAAVADLAGLGKELGGLLAGVALASSRYREAIAARLAPLRDFLLLFFFIALGARLDLAHLGAQVPAAVVFSLFVLIGNPLIVLVIMVAMGFPKRTGFLAGLTVAQISEFSLLFVGMGVAMGQIGGDILALVTLVGMITIAASTYMITYSHQLYRVCEPMLSLFDRRAVPWDPAPDADGKAASYDVLVFGAGRFGTAIAERLARAGLRTLGIDFNPLAVKHWSAIGLDARYGDATDPEFLASVPLGGVRWAVATVPVHRVGLTHDDPRLGLIHALKANGFAGKIAVTSHRAQDRECLVAAGADLILEPFLDAADRAAELLS